VKAQNEVNGSTAYFVVGNVQYDSTLALLAERTRCSNFSLALASRDRRLFLRVHFLQRPVDSASFRYDLRVTSHLDRMGRRGHYTTLSAHPNIFRLVFGVKGIFVSYHLFVLRTDSWNNRLIVGFT